MLFMVKKQKRSLFYIYRNKYMSLSLLKIAISALAAEQVIIQNGKYFKEEVNVL